MVRARGLSLILLLIGAMVVAGCGESKQDKAKKQVCSARSDIQKQVQSLKSLTPTTATTDGIKNSVKAIQDDLKKIADAQGNLDSSRKQQVQQATQTFTTQMQSIASSLLSSKSIADAQAAATSAGTQLANAYQQALQPIDCS